MGSIGNYDSELCQSGRSVFEWLWVLVGVGAGEARGTLYLPMVRPLRASSSSYMASSLPTATSNARFWVWVHLLVNLVAMAFLFTMNLCLPWVLNFNLSQARLLKETACNYVFSVLVHGIPSISAWISIHQNSQKLFCAKTSIGH